jgi:chromodomain-helicase-DNA-binding protein 4
LIGQWQSELRSWAPDLNVVLYHGSADARAFLVDQEFYYTDQFVPKGTAVKLKKHSVTKFHVLITTYEVVLKDINVLSKIKWKTLIVDEAHRLKNPRARLFEELLTVPRDYCVLLTGTPIANVSSKLCLVFLSSRCSLMYLLGDGGTVGTSTLCESNRVQG